MEEREKDGERLRWWDWDTRNNMDRAEKKHAKHRGTRRRAKTKIKAARTRIVC